MINEDGSVIPTMEEIDQIFTVPQQHNWIPESSGTGNLNITFSFDASEKPLCENCKGLGHVPAGIGFQDCIVCHGTGLKP